MAAKPAAEVVGIVEACARGGFGDGWFAAQGGLGGLESYAVAQGAEPEAGLALQFAIEVVGVVAEVPGNFPERRRGADMFAEFFEKRGSGRGCGGRMVEQAGDDGEDGRIVGQGEAAFAGDARKQGVELVQRRGRERAMGGSDATGVLEFVVEHEAEGPAAAGDRKAVRNLRRNHKEVPSAGPAAAAIYGLHALARKIENQLRVGVIMGGDLGVTVAVELEFA